MAQVSLGQVGAIFGLEVSRLARSSADLLRLLELCALFDTIIVDGDGIYDLGDFNDRLILGFKGTMSEAELHFLRGRLLGGKKNKAHKGELRFPLPVGYCHDENGNIVMDPDEEVRTAVQNVFSLFQSTGSAYGVVKFFAQNGLRFPKRAYGGAWAGKLVWGELYHNRVLGILYNPSYTGTYVFGRYKYRKKLDTDGMLSSHVVRLPQEQWEVKIFDHHPGYITWAQYEENLDRLAKNRTNAEVSGAAREGLALLQGLVFCGTCGRRMTVRYTGNGGIEPKYECRRHWENGRAVTCSIIRSELLDQAIEAKIMEALQPAQLELALFALDEALLEEDDVEKSWRLSMERAQYEVDRAERQYNLAEPENRLVVRSLESKWNEKLAEFKSLQEDYNRHRANQIWRPNANDREEILSLAQNLPSLWMSQTTHIKEKKRIVRILIEDITVISQPRESNMTVGIRWRSNYCESINITKPLPITIRRKHKEATVELISNLAQRLTDVQIAQYLNDNAYRTPENRLFTAASINWLRYRYRIPGPSKGDGFTVKEVAERFGVSKHVVYYLLDKGLLKGTKFAPGWPWNILVDEDTEKLLSEWVSKSKRIL